MKINLNPSQRIFFTSDTHYNHTNICRGTTRWVDANDITRDFKSLGEMNDRIVAGINTLVGENDYLFHLGDWSFGGFESIWKFRHQINCQNIHLILGNHDHHIERNRENIRDIFSSVNQYVELEVNREHKFVLMHYPIMSWNKMNEGVIHLHGHVHLPPHIRIGKGKMMDVGVDGNGLDPLSLTKVLTLLNPRPIKSGFDFDHHIKRVE
jgi:calcineurin-like phosphoesterase family protein